MPLRRRAQFMIIAVALIGQTTALHAQTHQPLKPDSRLQRPVSEMGLWGAPVSTRIGAMAIRGVFLSYVRPDGRAARSGLRRGDVVVKVNNIETSSPEQLKMVVKKLDGGILKIDILRDTGTRFEAKRLDLLTEDSRVSTASGAPPARLDKFSVQLMEAILLKCIEQDRAANGLSTPLKRSSKLCAMARSYADDMARRGYTGHIDPEGRGPAERAKLAGLSPKSYLAENCAYPWALSNPEEMVAQGERELMDSREHKNNILNPSNVSVGVGIAMRRDGGLYVVQEFSGETIP